MTNMQAAMKDLSSDGARFRAPFLRWTRHLTSENALAKIENGKTVDVHLQDKSWPISSPEDLAELHVLLSRGKPEQLPDPAVARILKQGVGPRLATDQGKTDAYSLYNVLTQQWPGQVIQTHHQQPHDREQLISSAFFYHHLNSTENLAHPERAESLLKLAHSPYGVSPTVSLDSVYHGQDPIYLGGSQAPRLRDSRVDPLLPQFVFYPIPDAVLNQPDQVQQGIDRLSQLHSLEVKTFGLHEKEGKVDLLLGDTVWRPEFDLAKCQKLMQRFANEPNGRAHLYALLQGQRALPDERQAEAYLKIAHACAGALVPANVLGWLTEKPESLEKRLPLQKACWGLISDRTRLDRVEEAARLARALEGSPDPAVAFAFAQRISQIQKPHESQHYEQYLALPPTQHDLCLQLLRESKELGYVAPTGTSFTAMQSEGWQQRLDAFSAGQISTTLAVLATNIFPEATPEARQLVTRLAPKDPLQIRQYGEALRFASQLKPEAQKVFTRLYAGEHLGRWAECKDVLFAQGRVPDEQSVKIIEFWRKKGRAHDSELRKTLGNEVTRRWAYQHVVEVSGKAPQRSVG